MPALLIPRAHSHAHQDALLVRADRTADQAEAAVGRVWRLILAAIDTPGPPYRVAQAVARAAAQLPHVGGAVLADLEAGAIDAARLTARHLAARLPARAVRRLVARRSRRPAGLLEDEGREGASHLIGGGTAPAFDLVDLILPPLLPEQVRKVVYQAGWLDRVRALTRLADPDLLAARVAAGVQAGWTVQRIAADIRPAVQGVVTSARRVARTAGLWVAHEAELHVYEEGLGDIVDGYAVRAVVDEATREKHRDRNGTRYMRRPKAGELGFEDMPRPPRESPRDGGGWAFNCLLPDQVVQGVFDLALKTRYSGEVVEARTRGGRTLSVTPNHPVCTTTGFLPAGQLREGDRLLCYTGEVGRSELGAYDDQQYPPTRIDQVFRAAEELRPPYVERGSALDFHGDTAGGDGCVQVVPLDGVLLGNIVGRRDRSNSIGDLGLVSSAMGVGATPGRGPLGFDVGGVDLAAASVVGGFGLAGAGLAVHAGPLHPLRIGLAAEIDARRREYPVKPTGGLATSGRRVSPADPEFTRELLHRFASVVAADDVVEIRKYDWSGHVYDLQSPGGWIVGNGVFVSNCRCYLDPILSADL